MALDGAETLADARRADEGNWIGPDGSGAVCVDLRGAVALLPGEVTVRDLRYCVEVIAELGYTSIAAALVEGFVEGGKTLVWTLLDRRV